MSYHVAEVRRNNSNGQKILTVPKDSDIHPGDKVRLVNLGKNWDNIPSHLKAFNNIENAIRLVLNADKPLDYGELNEVTPHLEAAGDSLDTALSVIKENRVVYGELTPEEIQEKCRHDKIKRGEDVEGGGWRCVNCGKAIPLDL